MGDINLQSNNRLEEDGRSDDGLSRLNASATHAAPLFDWRDVLPVHPLADAYPKVPHARLVEIGESIRQHGLDFPIFIHAKGNPADPEVFELFDGVTRLNAMAAVGVKFEFERFRLHRRDRSLRLVIHGIENDPASPTTKIFHNLEDGEIAAKIDNANLHRRHLEPDQFRARIKAALEREPLKSDRAHAEELGVDHKTVGKVCRSTGEASPVDGKRVGKDGKARKKPVKKAKTPATSSVPQSSLDAIADRAEASAAARRAAYAAEEQQLDAVCHNADFSAPDEAVATTAVLPTLVPSVVEAQKTTSAPTPDYTFEAWLTKSNAERRRIIDAWGERIIAGMSAEKVYEALPPRTCTDLTRRFTFKITEALGKMARAGVSTRSTGKIVTAGACLKLIKQILASKGLGAPMAPPASELSETVSAALRKALSLVRSSPDEALAALNVINMRLDGASLDHGDVNVVVTENAATIAEKAA